MSYSKLWKIKLIKNSLILSIGQCMILLSIGNKQFSVDILVAPKLKRNKLLSPDNFQIPFKIEKLNKDTFRFAVEYSAVTS